MIKYIEPLIKYGAVICGAVFCFIQIRSAGKHEKKGETHKSILDMQYCLLCLLFILIILAF